MAGHRSRGGALEASTRLGAPVEPPARGAVVDAPQAEPAGAQRPLREPPVLLDLVTDDGWNVASAFPASRLGRMLDYAVIVPRRQRLYEWSAADLREPRLLELVHERTPVDAWPFEARHVWRVPAMPFAAPVLQRATRAR